MSLDIPVNRKLAILVLQRTTPIPSAIVHDIIDIFLVSQPHVAASIIRRFNFIPQRVLQLNERKQFMCAICVRPFQHSKFSGLQEAIEFNHRGYPLMTIPKTVRITGQNRYLHGKGDDAFLCTHKVVNGIQTELLSEDQRDAISNGIIHHNWAGDYHDIRSRFFSDSDLQLAFGMVAAGLLGYDGNLHVIAIRTLLEPFTSAVTLQESIDLAHNSHSYPLIPLCILGVLLHDTDCNDKIDFHFINNDDVLLCVWQTALILQSDKPFILSRFINMVAHGLANQRLRPSPLAYRIIGALSPVLKKPRLAF